MTDTLTKRERIYSSKCHNQILTVKPQRVLRDSNGDSYGLTPVRHVVFSNHQFVANEEAAAALEMTYEELIQFIESRPGFNATNAPNAIWSEDTPPDEVSPTFAELSEAILAAATAEDVEALGRIIEQERETHNRAQVIQMARGALSLLAKGGATEV